MVDKEVKNKINITIDLNVIFTPFPQELKIRGILSE